LRTIALAAIAAQIMPTPLHAGGQLPPELQFLFQQQDLLGSDGNWRSALAQVLARPAASDRPLLALAHSLNLTLIDLLAVVLAILIEEEALVGRTLAYIQAPVGGARPTLSLLAQAFGELVPIDEHPIHTLLGGTALRCGLLALHNEGAPLPERSVSVPTHLCLALGGHDGNWPGASIGADGQAQVPLPPSCITATEQHAIALQAAPRRALVLRTGSTSEGRAVASAVAQALKRRPLFIEGVPPPGLGPWLLLRELLPVFICEPAPGERITLPAIAGYAGPLLAIAGPDGAVDLSSGSTLNWPLTVAPPEERRALWMEALGDGALANELAQHHRHGTGRIAQLAQLVHHQAAVAGSERPGLELLAAAAWSGEGTGLDALAQPITMRIPDEALVLPPALNEELQLLLLRCRARDGLAHALGITLTARYHPGVRALLVGPSGTGKTLAASWLATKLNMPLYRVDLASVTSKYIGETEKNLARLLARAEQAEVILLFDEADSLFGKRTDVRDANDRFANAQTNYLLQRIEIYDGITLLTSNSRSRFDESFSRRLDMVIEFPLPGPGERRGLWLAHLGAGHNLSNAEINQIAATADLGGGQIRNVVLAAAVLAHNTGRPILYADVVRALAGEYRKLGRQMPTELTPILSRSPNNY
jgi:hypothetical protein